jgi:hypothetical protein
MYLFARGVRCDARFIRQNKTFSTYTNVIYNLCQLIINLTVVNADWKEVWYNAVKRNWTITYFTSVLIIFQRKVLWQMPIKGAMQKCLEKFIKSSL